MIAFEGWCSARVDAAGECVDQLLAITVMDEGGEGERLLPKKVDHVFQIIGPFFDKALVFIEWIRLVSILSLQAGHHVRNGELCFPHGRR